VTGVVNAALKQASEEMDKEIQKATGGLKIPGIT
jgi:DNA-binding protein YbaB